MNKSKPGIINVKKEKPPIRITYGICFWLFMISNICGLVIEGLFCFFAYGAWESHVVTMWGPFCLLYGFGTVGYYIAAHFLQGKPLVVEFIGYCLVGDGLELIGGFLLEFGLGMRAWNYTDTFMNYRGYINLAMTLVWGAIGFSFSYFCPLVSYGLSHWEDGIYRVLIWVLSIFMAVNLIFTALCLYRWSRRHYGKPAESAFEEFLDRHYDDEYMAKRFIEWEFLDDVKKRRESNAMT